MGFIDRRLFTHMNWSLLACLCLLFGIGIANLYSASGVRVEEGLSVSAFYQRQLIWGGLGFMVMLFFMSFDYRHLQGLSMPLYILALIALMMIPFFGKVIYGARRWLDLGFFNFQPSEMAKLAVLIMGARVLALDGALLNWRSLGRVLFVGLVPAGFIMLQPDLGTGLTVLAILGGMILYHGIKPQVLKVCLLLIPLILPLLWFSMYDYQKQRVLTFLDPTSDPRGSGYQIIQSRIAIGSGEVWGKGFLQGTQSQLRFLPEKHTDFAIAVFGEEWGFVGSIALICLYSLFFLSIFATIRNAKDRFGSTVSVGIFIYFIWQATINIGMVVGLMPVVGIPLPFLSYGGSATLINFALVGIVLNVSMRRFVFK